MTDGRSPDSGPRPARLGRLGGWCARHPWLVIAAWVVALAVATFGHHAAGGSYADNFTLPRSPSQQGAALLRAHEPAAGGQGGQLVFTVTSGSLSADESAIETSMAQVRKVPHVLAASNPFSATSVSANGRTAYATVHFDTNPQQLGRSYVNQIDTAVTPARSAGVTVDYGGALGKAADPKGKDGRSELIGIVVALLVLLIGFGSVYAAGLPLLSAGLATITGVGVLGVIAASSTFPTVSPTLAAMMGLGVGIDYALFLTTRHRQLVMNGVDPADAAAQAVSSSGRAVIVAATTVVVALLALYASGVSFIGELGLAGAIAVAVGTIAALTLVPALLGKAGRRIDAHRLRRPVAESSATGGGWGRYARRIGSHPWRYLLAGVGLLCVLAIPVLSMRLGQVDAGADPASYTDKQAYDTITAAFGPGANGPYTIVVSLDRTKTSTPAQVQTLESKLHQALAATTDVAAVGPVTASPDGAILRATLIPRTSPQTAATDNLQTTLRDKTLPAALTGTGAKGYVTGSLSEQLDFRNQLAARLPLIIAVVIAAAFLLLLINFRGPVLALKAAVLNLLSIGAAYGVIVAVFQWGWGGSLLGVSGNVPIESYVPMMMFAIVFGLSMDYEVFLLSRIRESWLRTGDNHQSVTIGLAASARVISCAALIMTSVFLSFLLSTNVVIKMLALGLGASVLIDATVIRLIVVPAAMFLLGRYNWWTPSWLDRILPASRPRDHPLQPASDADTAEIPAIEAQPVPQRRRLNATPSLPARIRATLRRGQRPTAGIAAALLGAGVLAAFILTLVGTSSASSQTKNKTAGKLAASISATVGVGQVASASLASQLTLAGTVGGIDPTVSLTPQTSGTVTSLSISTGQTVTAGQEIAQLSDTQGVGAKQAAAQAQLAQAQAALAQAQSPQSDPASVAQAQEQVAAAQAALDDAKAKQTTDESASTTPTTTGKTTATTVSPLQLSEDATAVTDAQSQLNAAQQELGLAEHPPGASSNVISADQAAVNAAQDNLDAANQAVAELTVTAPVAGTVAQILVPVGGYASPATPIATLAGATQTLTAQASPMAVAALDGHTGAKATATLAVPNPPSSVSATLTTIAPTADATTQQTAVGFTTTAALQPNAPVTITVQLPQPAGPTVPTDTIVDNPNGQPGVYVVTSILNPAALGVKLPTDVPSGTEVGKATFTPVTTGISVNGTTQILSGLSAGETIVTTGQTDLTTSTAPARVAILPTGSSTATEPSSTTTTSPANSKTGAGAKVAAGIEVTVVAVHGSTLTVSTPIGQKTFAVPAGFTVTDHGKAIPLDSLHPGDVVKVTLGTKNGKRTVTSAALQ